MDTKTMADLDSRMLKAIIGLCPEKPGESVTLTWLGQSVTLTSEARAKGLAELARRARAKKEKKS